MRRAILFGVLAGALAACGGDNYSPTEPPSPAPGPAPITSSWTGQLTTVSCSGGRCGGVNVGEVHSGVRWDLQVSGSAITMYNLDADMTFGGTVEGRRFVATYPIIPWAYPDNSRIEGEFAPDMRSFEADETYYWVSPDGPTRIVSHWRVSRSG